jgi:MFS family permease
VPTRRSLTIGVFLTVVVIAFESIAVATAMPVAAQDLNGLAMYAWVFSLFLIGMLFATVVGGRLGDWYGPGRPLAIGLPLFAAGLLLAGTAQHMLQLVAARLVQGLGSGVINVAIFLVVARAYPAEHRARMFTYISTAWVLPAFVGPPISAWLTRQLSWHWVFFAVLPLVVLGGAMVLPALRRLPSAAGSTAPGRQSPRTTPEMANRPAPLWAAAVVAVAAAVLQYAGQRLDLVSLPLVVVGLAALLIGLPRLMPRGFLRLRRGLPQVILVRGLLPGAFFGAEAFIPLMLVEQREVPLVLAGAALTVGAVGWTLGSWLQSQSWLRMPRDLLITAGCGFVSLGLGLVAITAWWPVLWAGMVALAWAVAGLGMGLATASTSLAVMNLSRPEQQGRNASSLNLFDALGSGVLVGVAGTVFAALTKGDDLPVAFGTLFTTMAAVGLLAVLTSRRIGPVPADHVASDVRADV